MSTVVRKGGIRLAELIVVLLVVSFGVFLLTSLLPGDPAVAVLGKGHPPEEYAQLRHQMGLDEPLLQRYWSWLQGALTGDLGQSLVPPKTGVAERVFAALPVSVEIAVLGLLIAVGCAVPLAMWSAYHEGGRVDRVISASVFGILSVPSFLAGLILIMVAVNGLGWFPRAEWVRLDDGLLDNLRHAFLPAVTVSLMEMAMFTRVLRNDLIVTLREDFILAARARGMSPLRVMVSDSLRPSLFSLVTLLGLSLGRLIGSTVIVEYLFALPGVGSLVVKSASQGDFRMLQGVVLVIAVIYVIANAVIDLSYGYLDPRMRRVHT